MVPADLIGIWAATQMPPPVINQWIQPANDPWARFAVPVKPIEETIHYFLVVRRNADGEVSAFIRNPEANAGAFLGNRTLLAEGARLRFHAAGRPDVNGSVASDSLIIQDLPTGPKALAFHRASSQELLWYYPRPAATWTYRVPAPSDDGWPVGGLADAGMREAPIAALMSGIVSLRSPLLRSPYIQSITIARHGRLVVDEYFYGFSAAQPRDVRSAGKSVTSLLVGRAIEDTKRFTLATPVLSFLTQYPAVANNDARKRRMTVANLLTMTSGLACDDYDDNSPGNEDTMQSQSAQPDWYRYTLDLPMQYDPGGRAVYCTAGINLLGAIVARATGIPLEQYFYDRFAAPMQFGRYGMWLMPPPTNAAYMGGGDYFRPRDFLKFGELFLDGGTWNGRPVVDADWVKASAVQRSIMNQDAAGEGDRYGYGWHLATLTVDGRKYHVVDAGGNGGQIMAVVPELDMAVMITAGNYGQYPVWRAFLTQVVGDAIRAAT
ncbi:MAG: serine hydrolase [Candidatus Cybelea sp.]